MPTPKTYSQRKQAMAEADGTCHSRANACALFARHGPGFPSRFIDKHLFLHYAVSCDVNWLRINIKFIINTSHAGQ
jgi:hypothetical protein